LSPGSDRDVVPASYQQRSNLLRPRPQKIYGMCLLIGAATFANRLNRHPGACRRDLIGMWCRLHISNAVICCGPVLKRYRVCVCSWCRLHISNAVICCGPVLKRYRVCVCSWCRLHISNAVICCGPVLKRYMVCVCLSGPPLSLKLNVVIPPRNFGARRRDLIGMWLRLHRQQATVCLAPPTKDKSYMSAHWGRPAGYSRFTIAATCVATRSPSMAALTMPPA
jgi:hypothetical protein